MYWSAADTALVPAVVVTVMFTVPGLTDGGMVAVRVVEVPLMEPMLATLPKSTIGAPPVTRFVPWMVTLPGGACACAPEVGETDVTVGAFVGAYVNSSIWARPVELDDPALVPTVTTTVSGAVPAGSAGASAESSPSQLTCTLVAATPPKKT